MISLTTIGFRLGWGGGRADCSLDPQGVYSRHQAHMPAQYCIVVRLFSIHVFSANCAFSCRYTRVSTVITP